MELVGEVEQMDVDKNGKANGAFLRARVALDIKKSLKRGVLLRMKKTKEPKWFEVQYEKLSFFCFACGLIGHSEIECNLLGPRNESGTLPYDLPLRAPEERTRKTQSFAEATSMSFGSGALTETHYSRSSTPPGEQRPAQAARGSDQGSGEHDTMEVGEEEEVQSPEKTDGAAPGKGKEIAATSRQLFWEEIGGRIVVRKRK